MTTQANFSLGIYDRATIIWSWLFPLSYLIHIAEEYWGGEGYPAYIFRLRGVHMTTGRFLFAQGLGVVLVTIGIVAARQLKFLPMMLVILGALVAGNCLTHLVTALSIMQYGPGLVSTTLIWGPLGIATIVRFKSAIDDPRQYWLAIAIGIGINVIVAIVTMRGGRLV
ncbi:MAG TPA: HXXEE domain-containing protein [Pyrinomonadaceae bacterium]|nr:HXXEE domain-containing protein [Pyrinomonadaceae bacterium]